MDEMVPVCVCVYFSLTGMRNVGTGNVSRMGNPALSHKRWPNMCKKVETCAVEVGRAR